MIRFAINAIGLSLAWLLSMCIFSCRQGSGNVSTKRDSLQLSDLAWQDTTISLGMIKLGETYPLTFKLKNIGESPLRITKIESTCGCTVIDKHIQTPISPGQTDSITAHIKLDEGSDSIVRKVYVMANTQKQFYVLRVTGFVASNAK